MKMQVKKTFTCFNKPCGNRVTFLVTLKERKEYEIVCDKCGARHSLKTFKNGNALLRLITG